MRGINNQAISFINGTGQSLLNQTLAIRESHPDLIVLDMKLFCLDELTLIINGIAKLQKSILKFAEKNQDVIIPAYTHLQAAQVVLLSHHMLAYIEMLERDKGRLMDAVIRTESPIPSELKEEARNTTTPDLLKGLLAVSSGIAGITPTGWGFHQAQCSPRTPGHCNLNLRIANNPLIFLLARFK